MTKLLAPLMSVLACAAMISLSPVADARAAGDRQDVQRENRKQMTSGEVLSKNKIEAIVIPRMRGMKYLGFKYDPTNKIYTLRFIKGQRVVDVFVDARSGAILEKR